MSGRRRGVMAGAVVLVIAVLVALALLLTPAGRPFGFGDGVPQDRPGPVLLVTGYGGGVDALEVLAEVLREQGRDARVVPPVDEGTGDLSAQASALDAEVTKALGAGAPSVDLVGFSAGGVAVRYWAANYDGRNKARRIVTLGSPHHGTESAGAAAALLSAACPAACLQLAPNSDLLRDLNRGDETPDGPRWVSIWTTGDRTVTPPETARLDGAVNVAVQDVCPGQQVAHGDLPRNAVSGGLVLLALDKGLDAPPARNDCAGVRRLYEQSKG